MNPEIVMTTKHDKQIQFRNKWLNETHIRNIIEKSVPNVCIILCQKTYISNSLKPIVRPFIRPFAKFTFGPEGLLQPKAAALRSF